MIQYLVTVIINLIVGGISFSKRQLNGAKALSFVSLCLASWIFELYLLTVISDKEILDTLFHLFRVGMFFIPSALALFAWRLVNRNTSVFLYGVIVPGFISALSIGVLNNTFFPTSLRQTNVGYQPEIDILYMVFIGNFVWCLLWSLVYSGYHFFKSRGRDKEKIRWLMIAMMASFISGGVSLYLFQYDTYLSKLAGPATNILFVSLLLYATIQHNLMDLRLALSHWATRLLLLSLFCWVYFYLSFSLNLSVDSFGGAVTLMLFFVIVLELYPRMLSWVMPGSKRLFGAEGIDFDRLTAEMRFQFSKTITINEIVECLEYLATKVVFSSSHRFLLNSDESKKLVVKSAFSPTAEFVVDRSCLPMKDSQKKFGFYLIDEVKGDLSDVMNEAKADGCVVFLLDEKVIGLLLVGPPRDRSYFRYDDIRVFEWLSSELPQTLKRVIEIEKFEKELVEAKKKLSLLNVMSHYHHDIKAPFSIIDGVVTHELYDKSEQRKIILEQVSLGSKLISTMASLLKGDRKRNVGQVSIDAVVKDCMLIFSHVLARSEIDVGKDAIILGDADDLKILFINIIKNAAEATRSEEKVSIKVKAWTDKNTVSVSIADNGEGIASDQLKVLWNSGRTTKENGSGIGLQAIKRIAEEHCATINVSSQKGEGTDFTLVFPLSA